MSLIISAILCLCAVVLILLSSPDKHLTFSLRLRPNIYCFEKRFLNPRHGYIPTLFVKILHCIYSSFNVLPILYWLVSLQTNSSEGKREMWQCVETVLLSHRGEAVLLVSSRLGDRDSP